MPYTIKLTPTAFNDLQKGIDYYDAQQKGLGKKFKLSIESIFSQIKELPLS